jgi:hypothetical protein
VLAQSGDRSLLRHIEAQDTWTLEGFRSHRVDGVACGAGKSDTPLATALIRCN